MWGRSKIVLFSLLFFLRALRNKKSTHRHLSCLSGWHLSAVKDVLLSTSEKMTVWKLIYRIFSVKKAAKGGIYDRIVIYGPISRWIHQNMTIRQRGKFKAWGWLVSRLSDQFYFPQTVCHEKIVLKIESIVMRTTNTSLEKHIIIHIISGDLLSLNIVIRRD